MDQEGGIDHYVANGFGVTHIVLNDRPRRSYEPPRSIFVFTTNP